MDWFYCVQASRPKLGSVTPALPLQANRPFVAFKAYSAGTSSPCHPLRPEDVSSSPQIVILSILQGTFHTPPFPSSLFRPTHRPRLSLPLNCLRSLCLSYVSIHILLCCNYLGPSIFFLSELSTPWGERAGFYSYLHPWHPVDAL